MVSKAPQIGTRTGNIPSDATQKPEDAWCLYTTPNGSTKWLFHGPGKGGSMERDGASGTMTVVDQYGGKHEVVVGDSSESCRSGKTATYHGHHDKKVGYAEREQTRSKYTSVAGCESSFVGDNKLTHVNGNDNKAVMGSMYTGVKSAWNLNTMDNANIQVAKNMTTAVQKSIVTASMESSLYESKSSSITNKSAGTNYVLSKSTVIIA
jgi:hypothetical protein